MKNRQNSDIDKNDTGTISTTSSIALQPLLVGLQLPDTAGAQLNLISEIPNPPVLHGQLLFIHVRLRARTGSSYAAHCFRSPFRAI